MEILTYINFLGAGEAAQTGDNTNFVLFLLVICALLIAATLYFVLKSNRISAVVKKVIGIGVPSVFLILAIPFGFATQSHAYGSSTSLDAVVDPETCTAYIQNGTIQNTTSDDMMLIVANSYATNAGLNIPGLQNANLKVAVGNYVIFEGNPFDGYDSDLLEDYVLKPGQAVQYSTELTGLDQQTCLALEGSGNSIQMRFKFYYSFDWNDDGTWKYTDGCAPQPVADYLYEVGYDFWNSDKCNFICECIGKSAYIWGPDTKEYKDYLRKEWGLNDDQIQIIVQIRKYFEETDPYFPALCTSCRNGDFVGRNFDWAYDDLDEYVVRAKGTNDRYKSLGVVSSFFPQWLQDLIDIETMLPMLTMDGINDQGVAVNINIVPPDAFGATTGTNPGAKRLCAGVIPRFVLDNASSAEEAVNLLRNRDIFTVTFSEFHFMISDLKESYIVETCNNELVVLKQEVPNPTAMSNFHVSNSDYYEDYECICGKTEIGPVWAAHSLGVERYELAMKDITSVKSLDDMVNHMKPIYYKEVNTNWANKRFWSDKNGQESDLSDHVFSFYDKDEGTRWDAEREDKFRKNQKNYNDIHEREKQIGQRVLSEEGFNGVSQTVNSSCYDIRKKMLALTVQERAVTFNFNLNGTFREGATGIFVNGDNVGLATKSTEPGSEWTYDSTTGQLALTSTSTSGPVLYSITGKDTFVKITTEDKIGSSIIIPLMDHVQTMVTVGQSNPEIVKNARKGVRVVTPGSYVTVTFKADTGYEFLEDDSDYHIVNIESMGQGNIIFGKTPNYDLPTVVDIDD